MTPEQTTCLEIWKSNVLGSIKAELSLKHEDLCLRLWSIQMSRRDCDYAA